MITPSVELSTLDALFTMKKRRIVNPTIPTGISDPIQALIPDLIAAYSHSRYILPAFPNRDIFVLIMLQ